MCCLCPEEFNTKRLQLSYPHSLAFSTSPFFALPLFLLYRLAVAFYCLAWLVFSAFYYNDYFFLYLSNWTFILVTVYLFLGLYLTVISCCGGEDHHDNDDNDDNDFGRFGTCRFKSETYIVGLTSSDDSETEGTSDARLHTAQRYKNEEEDETKCYHKVTWFIFTLASTNSLVVTALFWLVQFPRDQPALDGLDITTHTLSSVFLLVEVVVSNIPVRLLHHLYSHIFQSVYILFTVIYWAAGGTDGEGNTFIYPLLDYADDPSMAVASVFAVLIIALPLAQMLFYALFRLRGWVVSKLV